MAQAGVMNRHKGSVMTLVPRRTVRAGLLSALLAGLLGGCISSSEPLLPAREALSEPDLTGRYAASAGQGKLQVWNVTRDGAGYLLNVIGDQEKIKGALYKYDDRYWLAQIGPVKDSGTDKYLYWLLYTGQQYILVNDIPCDTTIAKELNLQIEADNYSCNVKSRAQLDALVHRAADRFLDRERMVPVLRTNEPQ